MAWRFPLSTSGSGRQIDLGDGFDDLYVAAQVFIASTDDDTVRGFGSNHDVRVYGTIASAFSAVFLGNEATDSGNRVFVEKGARVDCITVGQSAAVVIVGTEAEITNRGALTGYYGAYLDISGAGPVESTLSNSGVIEATNYAVYHTGSETLTASNTGLITSADFAFFSNSTAIDKLTNTGTIVGKVTLGDGADIFDSRGGAFTGVADGGLGADKLYTGTGNNSLSGGAGNDILAGGAGADRLNGGADTDAVTYFYASAGVTVSLTSPSTNKGDAAGDTFLSIENISGSAFNDSLAGNSVANTIYGNSGNDVIRGYAGNDTLTGASGKDTFIFHTALNPTTNVDKITDFSAIDDTIQLENGIFTALTATGALSAAAFRANGTGVAADSTDRIVYETDTGKIFYDRDGSGTSYDGVLFATLVNKPTITSSDFVVI
ncbi:calcium-binding protein [Pararhizobium arenae]|uniref:calcium-binding protein n=1 Tax=Pararhizobium arenae TaxID=1856850 RepID=UPI000AF93E87|nr:calcium-binding protein [Pararhizobium arenae]